ncbi:MAG: TonB family protein [Neisseriaceae bacterium]|nr:TonB family protein [Neisseriaceae bacterium]
MTRSTLPCLDAPPKKIPSSLFLGAAVFFSIALHLLFLSVGSLHAPILKPESIKSDHFTVALTHTANLEQPNKGVKIVSSANNNANAYPDSYRDKILSSPLPPQGISSQPMMDTLMALARHDYFYELNPKSKIAPPIQSFAQKNTQKLGRTHAETEKGKVSPAVGAIGPTLVNKNGLRIGEIGMSTLRVSYAEYVDDWRRKIEKVGRKDYPKNNLGMPLSGTLIMTVMIKNDGTIIGSPVVNKSSNNRSLDLAAKKIIRDAMPFKAFPSEAALEFDALSITREWHFSSPKLRTQ